MNGDLLLSGDLSEIRLPVLLMSIYKGQESATLTISGEHYRKTLFIEEGHVVFASSNNPDDRLGETLLRRGIITVQQYLNSAEMIRPGKRQGEILIEQGAITPEGLVEGVRLQVLDIIFSLFSQNYGTYSLDMEEFSAIDMVTIAMEMPLLIKRGMSQATSWNSIYPVVGAPATRLRVVSNIPSFLPALDLSPEAEHLFGLCRQGMSVEALLEASYLNQFETYRMLWIFLTLGLLEKASADVLVPGGAALNLDPESLLEHYNAIFSFIHGLLAQNIQDVAGAVGRTLDPVRAAHLKLSADQDGLMQYGRLDIDIALAVLRSFPEAEKEANLRSYLDDVLYAMVFLVDRSLDEDKRKAVHEHVRRESQHLYGG